MTCLCPTGPAVTITNPARHAAWHAECEAQGIPPGRVDIEATERARGRRTVPVARAARPDAAPSTNRPTVRYHRR